MIDGISLSRTASIRWTSPARKRSPSFPVVHKKWVNNRVAKRKAMTRMNTLNKYWQTIFTKLTQASTPTSTSSADIDYNELETCFNPVGHNPSTTTRSITPILYPPGTSREEEMEVVKEEKEETETEQYESDDSSDEDIPLDGHAFPLAPTTRSITPIFYPPCFMPGTSSEEEMEVEEEEEEMVKEEEEETETEQSESDEDMPLDGYASLLARGARSLDPRVRGATARMDMRFLASIFHG